MTTHARGCCRRTVAALVVSVAVVAATLWLAASPPTASDEAVARSTTPSAVAAAAHPRASDPHVAPDPPARRAADAPPVADPVAVRIPAADVTAHDIKALDVLDDGTLEVPSDPQRVGWWRAGPEPGERGAAVVVGHVDSRDGPGVFFRLRHVTAGDRVDVDRADGTTATFRVVRVEQHAKDRFPTSAVYGATTEPTLRLVTCGGAFDRATGHYVDNIIVFAQLSRQ